jgi:hypothetical protein
MSYRGLLGFLTLRFCFGFLCFRIGSSPSSPIGDLLRFLREAFFFRVAASASAVSWSGPGEDGGDEVMDSEFERGDELRSIFHFLACVYPDTKQGFKEGAEDTP